jgi:PAS domain-containing protein
MLVVGLILYGVSAIFWLTPTTHSGTMLLFALLTTVLGTAAIARWDTQRRKVAPPRKAAPEDEIANRLEELKRQLRDNEKGGTFVAIFYFVLLIAFFPWSLLFLGGAGRDGMYRDDRSNALKAEIARLEGLLKASPDVRAAEVIKEEELRLVRENQYWCRLCGENTVFHHPQTGKPCQFHLHNDLSLAPCYHCGRVGGLLPWQDEEAVRLRQDREWNESVKRYYSWKYGI